MLDPKSLESELRAVSLVARSTPSWGYRDRGKWLGTLGLEEAEEVPIWVRGRWTGCLGQKQLAKLGTALHDDQEE